MTSFFGSGGSSVLQSFPIRACTCFVLVQRDDEVVNTIRHASCLIDFVWLVLDAVEGGPHAISDVPRRVCKCLLERTLYCLVRSILEQLGTAKGTHNAHGVEQGWLDAFLDRPRSDLALGIELAVSAGDLLLVRQVVRL